MSKYFSEFITLDCNESNLYPQGEINELNYQKVLNYIPIPITLWELKGEDFFLVFSNNSVEEITEPKLAVGNELSKVLPDEYKRIFFHQSSNFGKNYSAQMMIDKNLLLIIHTELNGNQINQNPKLTKIASYGQNDLIGKNLRMLKAENKSSEEFFIR